MHLEPENVVKMVRGKVKFTEMYWKENVKFAENAEIRRSLCTIGSWPETDWNGKVKCTEVYWKMVSEKYWKVLKSNEKYSIMATWGRNY